MDKLLALQNVALVDNVAFRLNVGGKKFKTPRKLLLISTNALNDSEKTNLLQLFKEEVSDSISFPMKERGTHLKVRIENNIYNFGRFLVNYFPKFRTRELALGKGKTLEVVLRLQAEEREKLNIYLRNIKRNRKSTIGSFSMNGNQFTNGKLDDNRSKLGGHNCSSWIGTAPIGAHGEPLIELLGGDRDLQVATNPGWWTNWLAAAAPQERIPFIIFWTPEPIGEAKKRIESGKILPWDFYRH